MKPRVTVIEPEGPEAWFAALAEIAEVEFFNPRGPVQPAEIDGILAHSAAVVITSATAISNDQLLAATGLKLIAKCGGAPSNIDVEYAARCGVAVSCVPGANTTTIAEYTVMLIIAALRRFDLQLPVIRQGGWRSPDFLLGHDLRGATVGIVGLGAIGREVLDRLVPFGCRLLVYSPHARKGCADDGRFSFVETLEEMLPRCDAVTLHCRVDEATRGFFDERLFKMMKPGSVFVNTARGALVDEPALARALENGPLSAAAVDVFQVEPPQSGNPLLRCGNALLAPHSAGWTGEALRRECRGAVRSVLAYFRHERIPGLLNEEYIRHLR